MTVRRITVGTGIREREGYRIEGPITAEDLRAVFGKIDSPKDRLATYEAALRDSLGAANCPPEQGNNPYPDESGPWFQWEALNLIGFIVACAERGESWNVFSFSYDLGRLLTEAHFKFGFEADYLLGRKVRGGGHKGTSLRHGDESARAAVRRRRVESYCRARAAGHGKEAAKRLAAREHGCSTRQIHRDVKDARAD